MYYTNVVLVTFSKGDRKRFYLELIFSDADGSCFFFSLGPIDVLPSWTSAAAGCYLPWRAFFFTFHY